MWASLVLFFLFLSLSLGASADERLIRTSLEILDGESIDLAEIDGKNIQIDGRLNETVWKELPFYDEFVVIEPDSLKKPIHSTRVKIFYDKSGIYFGIDMDQPEKNLVRRLSGRDAGLVNRDSINITLDTSGTGRYGYWFGLNLGDSLSDGTLLPEKRFSSEWDGVWHGSTQRTANGWSGEFFIPWSTVSMPDQDGRRRLGLFMSRKVAYLDERWGWPSLPFTMPKFISSLKSLWVNGINPTQQYSVSPFASLDYDKNVSENSFQAGIDFNWRPSTDFQMTGTVNPDFGSVESDDVVINLSATETFFPEKRPFFLEGQDVFVATPRASIRSYGGFANEGAPTTLVNTRRIGGKPNPPITRPGVSVPDSELQNPVDLSGALKVTGQSGKVRYGLLSAFEDDFFLSAISDEKKLELSGTPSDYGIIRLLYEDNDLGSYRSFGLMSTAVLNDEADAFTHGLDGHYLSEGGKLRVDGQFFTSKTGHSGKGYGGFVDLEYTLRQGIKQRIGIEYQDENVDLNDLGFLERNDNFRLRTAHTRFNPNPSWARNNYFDVRGYIQRNRDGFLTGAGLFLVNRMTFDNLSKFTFRAGFSPSRYDDLNSFGNGTYSIEQDYFSGVLWETNSSKPISFKMGAGYSREDLGGDSKILRLEMNWQPEDQFFFSAGLRYMNRSGWLLHQNGNIFATFDAEQWQPKISADYFVTARQHIRASFQWVGIKALKDENFSLPPSSYRLIRMQRDAPDDRGFSVSQMSLQLRYRWEIAPLSDLFLVYTRLVDSTGPIKSFDNIFTDGYQKPFQDLFVVKLRYRFGS